MTMEVISADLQSLLGEKVMLIANLELNITALSRSLNEAQAAKCDCDKGTKKKKEK